MSSLKSAVAILGTESNSLTPETGKSTGPVLVASSAKRPENRLTRRVEAALDADFANGSMPA